MKINKKSILVLGGTTFVSSRLTQYFISKGYIVDILSRGKNSVTYAGIREHIKVDRKDVVSMKKALNNKIYNYVFDISAYDKEDATIIIEALNIDNIEKYIFCSSGAVYEPSLKFLTEESPLGLNQNWGDYGSNKKKAEDVFLKLHEERNFPITIFRPTYIYGEENNLYRETYFFDSCLINRPILIPGNGTTETQFIHIDDVILSFESILNNSKTNGQCFNLTNPEVVTWNKLIKTVGNVCGNPLVIQEVSFDLMKKYELTSRDFFPFRDVTYLMDISKLLNFNVHIPNIDLSQGLIKSFEWYKMSKFQIVDSKMNRLNEILNKIRN